MEKTKMKKQIKRHRQTVLLTTIAGIILLLLCASVSIFAQAGNGQRTSVKTQTGVGKRYGARDPETCQATGGSRVPSSAEAIASFKCNMEDEVSNQLILTEDVSIQIGKAHPFNPSFGSFEPNIDTKYLIYSIRGSFKQYKCRPITDNAGRNCWIYDHPNAEGECYKTEWGDWHCLMLDKNDKMTAENVPPPGSGSTDTAVQNTTGKNNPVQKTAPKNDSKVADNPADKNTDDKPAPTGQPKPDFSEMEKWFDIVRYEYSDPAGTLTFWVKPKTDTAKSLFWGMQFLDKNGDMVTPNDDRYGFGVGWRSGSGNAGEVMKMDCYTPSESNMERVVSAKIVRIKQ